jgi:hypothetical protein
MFYENMMRHNGDPIRAGQNFAPHALGPWLVTGNTDAPVQHGLTELAIVRADGEDSSEVIGSVFGRTADEMHANANMIAAAPKMFAALEQLEAYARTHMPESDLHEMVISALEVAILGQVAVRGPQGGEAS